MLFFVERRSSEDTDPRAFFDKCQFYDKDGEEAPGTKGLALDLHMVHSPSSPSSPAQTRTRGFSSISERLADSLQPDLWAFKWKTLLLAPVDQALASVSDAASPAAPKAAAKTKEKEVSPPKEKKRKLSDASSSRGLEGWETNDQNEKFLRVRPRCLSSFLVLQSLTSVRELWG
jgi:hypothetical protein